MLIIVRARRVNLEFSEGGDGVETKNLSVVGFGYFLEQHTVTQEGLIREISVYHVSYNN